MIIITNGGSLKTSTKGHPKSYDNVWLDGRATKKIISIHNGHKVGMRFYMITQWKMRSYLQNGKEKKSSLFRFQVDYIIMIQEKRLL